MTWINPFVKPSPGHSCDPPYTLPEIINISDVWQCDYCGSKWLVDTIDQNRLASYVKGK
jgi:hypothetical protein